MDALEIDVEQELKCPFRSEHPNTTDGLWSPGNHALCGALDRKPCVGLNHENCPVNAHPDGVVVTTGWKSA